MLIDIITSYLIFNGIKVVLNKYKLIDAFKLKALNMNRFFYELQKCDFCMDHHLAIISTIVIGLFLDFKIYFLIIPFIVASINNIRYEASRKKR